MDTFAKQPFESRMAHGLTGVVRVPGDKSISHRALMLGAVAIGETRVEGLLEAEDVLNTARAMNALGAKAERSSDGALAIKLLRPFVIGPKSVPRQFETAGC